MSLVQGKNTHPEFGDIIEAIVASPRTNSEHVEIWNGSPVSLTGGR
jgi:hypothetical protein